MKCNIYGIWSTVIWNEVFCLRWTRPFEVRSLLPRNNWFLSRRIYTYVPISKERDMFIFALHTKVQWSWDTRWLAWRATRISTEVNVWRRVYVRHCVRLIFWRWSWNKNGWKTVYQANNRVHSEVNSKWWQWAFVWTKVLSLLLNNVHPLRMKDAHFFLAALYAVIGHERIFLK